MKSSNTSLSAELRATLKLAGPIVLSQAGQMLMGLVDTLAAGRLGTTAQAGLGLGANFFWTFTAVCMGCLMALDTYFSQAAGARDDRALSRYLDQSFWLALFVGLFSATGLFIGYLLYVACAAPTPTRDAMVIYLRNVSWCLPSLFAFFVLQRYWQARHRVLGFMIFTLAANVLNLAACFALGLGYWGFPPLGVKGIAYATVISRYAMLLAACCFTWYFYRPQTIRLVKVDWKLQREMLALGLPAAGHTALEICAFTIATFVIGTLGPTALAAHHICIMLATFTFMFPLGFSAAAAVRVGNYVGAGQFARARVAGWLCIGLSVTVMAGFSLIYLTCSRTMMGWFNTDPAVISLGMKILSVVALFQIMDGTQVSATGALRGLGDTRTPMYANLIGHYPIGLAIGMAFCFSLGWGVVGLWTGLATGLCSVAVLVLRSWIKTTRKASFTACDS
jgi:MATE family multidrug resistance protein